MPAEFDRTVPASHGVQLTIEMGRHYQVSQSELFEPPNQPSYGCREDEMW
jgi:hypothetical protein